MPALAKLISAITRNKNPQKNAMLSLIFVMSPLRKNPV